MPSLGKVSFAAFLSAPGCVPSFALSGRGLLRVVVTALPRRAPTGSRWQGGIDDRAAERLVKREDVGRAEFLKRFYEVEREVPTHYDVVVNTDVLRLHAESNVIVAAAG